MFISKVNTFYCQRMRKNRKTSPCSLKKWGFSHKVGAVGGKYEFGLNFPNSLAPCLTIINAISAWCFWKDATKIIALPCSIWKLLQLQPLWNTLKFCHKGNFVKIMKLTYQDLKRYKDTAMIFCHITF